jgi:hypothetical protein
MKVFCSCLITSPQFHPLFFTPMICLNDVAKEQKYFWDFPTLKKFFLSAE